MKTPYEVLRAVEIPVMEIWSEEPLRGENRIERLSHTQVVFALEALDAAGYVIVPREPTEEMLGAVYGNHGEESGSDGPARNCWADFLAARP